MNLYETLISEFQITEGETIWLSSETLGIARLFAGRGLRFDPSLMIDTFLQALGEHGTLLLPVFSFTFSNQGFFDYLHTKGTTGVLGNTALQRPDFKRTTHPLHSFTVWGRDKDLLCGMENRHSFGADSPFAYCHRENVRQIMLGTDYVHAMTFVHYAETVCNVPYRFPKQFQGRYVTADGTEEIRTYDYAARKTEVGTTEMFNRMGAVLEEKGIARRIETDGIISHVARLGDSFDLICEDITKNMCRNLYDFNVSREDLFRSYRG